MEEELIIIENNDIEEFVTIEEGTQGSGTNNYNYLNNKPKINDIELKGNKTTKQLGLQEEIERLTNMEIEEILNSFVGG